MSTFSILGVERHFAYYRSMFWEEQPLLHGFFVWPMLFNLIVILSYSVVLYPRPLWVDTHVPYFLSRYIVLNYSFVAASFYSVYYVALDPHAGFLASAMVICCWIGANAFSQFVPWEIGWKVQLDFPPLTWRVNSIRGCKWWFFSTLVSRGEGENIDYYLIVDFESH